MKLHKSSLLSPRVNSTSASSTNSSKTDVTLLVDMAIYELFGQLIEDYITY